MRARFPIHHAFARDHRAERHAAGDSFCDAENIRLDSGVIAGPPFSGAAHAALHFIGYQHNSVLARDALQLAQKFRRRGNVSAFALHRLNENCGDVAGIYEALEKFVLNEVDAVVGGDVRDRDPDRAREKRRESASRILCAAPLWMR